jgi:hypothetical protein
MPENGVIFSDGIEADRLDFNSGTEAQITIAERQGRLIVRRTAGSIRRLTGATTNYCYCGGDRVVGTDLVCG